MLWSWNGSCTSIKYIRWHPQIQIVAIGNVSFSRLNSIIECISRFLSGRMWRVFRPTRWPSFPDPDLDPAPFKRTGSRIAHNFPCQGYWILTKISLLCRLYFFTFSKIGFNWISNKSQDTKSVSRIRQKLLHKITILFCKLVIKKLFF